MAPCPEQAVLELQLLPAYARHFHSGGTLSAEPVVFLPLAAIPTLSKHARHEARPAALAGVAAAAAAEGAGAGLPELQDSAQLGAEGMDADAERLPHEPLMDPAVLLDAGEQPLPEQEALNNAAGGAECTAAVPGGNELGQSEAAAAAPMPLPAAELSSRIDGAGAATLEPPAAGAQQQEQEQQQVDVAAADAAPSAGPAGGQVAASDADQPGVAVAEAVAPPNHQQAGGSEGGMQQQAEQECMDVVADDTPVKGLLLITCRTALSGRFPLNGTYFQVLTSGPRLV